MTGIVIPDGGTIGSTSDTDAISIASDGQVTIAQNNPTITLGSNAILPDGTMCGFTETTTTPTATQGSDLIYTTMTGSSVDYTPVSGSSFVVYNYSYLITNNSVNPLILYKFFYDGGEISNTNHAQFIYFGDSNGALGYKTFTFVLPSWSGSKNLQVKYRIYSSSYTARIHQSAYSGDATGTDVYVKTYRTTYSVM
jgi:hypothetical protein